MAFSTVARRARAPRKNRPSRSALGGPLQGWLYALPTALFVAALFLIPLLLVLQMSGSDWPLLRGNQGWNFPQNYTEAVDLRLFWDSIWFTLKYTIITTVLLIGLGLGLAMLVQESTAWKGFLRTSFLIPSALGLASASLLFYVLYSPFAGPFADLMQKWGFTFLGTPEGALWSTVFLIVWRYAGFYMLLMLVGLQGIPDDVFEAARIDGASRWQTFRHITVPLLRPTFALTIVLCVTGSLLAFDQFYILTKGGPDNSTMTIVQLIYNVAFQGRNDLGIAAALSVIVLLALIVINVIQLRAFRKPEEA
ncbi:MULTISPECIES: carbohydrate ABC transporter permease [Microbacterium]|uniref:carbohydrate ABC transporter permease n=1 Tax=Microbacterium TaxID=33882 RepID=UPI0006FF2D69|nr:MULTISPECIES: sugar ABC transporter permease [Microbacterium]KQP70083.1 ABC transporter permease [Microbacterium sp. Leaf288]MDR7113447.1 multiple sugar transport system permease protein [Microbacterium trichothecenolyticum]MDT0141044.1 sugar ABC transporter permease [Microbacterium sp. PRC9]